MDTFFLSDIIRNISDLAQTAGWYLFPVIIVLLLLGLLTILSAFESAFFSLMEKEETEIKRSTRKNHKSLRKLLNAPLQTSGTIILCHYMSLVTVITAAVLLLNKALSLTILPAIVNWCIIFFAVTFLILVFNEFFPKLLKKRRISFLLRSAGIIRFLSFVALPFLSLFLRLTTLVGKRLETKTYRAISINELSETLKLRSAGKKEEKEILQGIVNFGRIDVDKIMKPRVDIVDIDLKSDFEAVIRIIRESEYSRLPVYEGSIDNIKGILYIKDLLRYLDEGKTSDWQSLIREAYFVPETKK